MQGPAINEGAINKLEATRSRQYDFDVFISYSHSDTISVASAVQRALENIARPWYKRRAIRVFRDETNLAVTPELWPSIDNALMDSHFFVLIASPMAARSQWVQREVAAWIQQGRKQRLLIVVAAGTIRWDAACRDFDWSDTNALPYCLAKVFDDEPLWADVRWALTDDDLSVRTPRFFHDCAMIAAPVRRMRLEQIIRAHNREKQKLGAGISFVTLLVVGGVALGLISFWEAKEARLEALQQRSDHLTSLAQQSLAKNDNEKARLLALAAQGDPLQGTSTKQGWNSAYQIIIQEWFEDRLLAIAPVCFAWASRPTQQLFMTSGWPSRGRFGIRVKSGHKTL